MRVVAVGELHQCRITGIGRIGVAQELLAVREHHVVVATRCRRNGIGEGLAEAVILRIDDRQGGIAVLVLECPDIAGRGIDLQAIDIACDLEALVDMA